MALRAVIPTNGARLAGVSTEAARRDLLSNDARQGRTSPPYADEAGIDRETSPGLGPVQITFCWDCPKAKTHKRTFFTTSSTDLCAGLPSKSPSLTVCRARHS